MIILRAFLILFILACFACFAAFRWEAHALLRDHACTSALNRAEHSNIRDIPECRYLITEVESDDE